ncbi:MAG: peptidylprolyl isomerase [Alphaproteobacteria bacterium]
MVMKALRHGASGGIAKFILFGLMTMAVAGLVLMDIGGFFRSGGMGGNNVIMVGREAVSIQTFDQELRRSVARLNITPQQAFDMGYVDQLLMSKVQSKVIARAADEHGLLVGKPHIAKQISQLIMPMVKPGQDPKDVFNQVLRSQGLNEKDMVREIGEQTTGRLFLSALQSGFSSVSPDIARDLAIFQKETRTIKYVAFPNASVKIADPTDGQIAALYELRKPDFAEPEMRTFKIIRIRDEALKQTIAISEEEIKDAYEGNIVFYKTDENRIFEQALVASEEAAKNIANSAAARDLKAAVKKETGNTNEYMGEENSTEASLLPDIKADIEKAEKAGDVIGPVKSPLGWHIIKIKKISPESVRSLESARKEITAELQENRLAEERYAMAGTVEDLLASGSSLENINKEVKLDVTALPAMNQRGQTATGADALGTYKDAAQQILENGFALEQGTASSMIELPDGQLIGVYLETLKPETYVKLEKVKEDLKKDWMREQVDMQNRMQARAALETLEAGADLKAFATAQNKSLQKTGGIMREQKKAPLSESALVEIFESDLNKPFLIDIDGGVGIAAVTDANIPDSVDTSSKNYTTLEQNLEKSLQSEAVMQYLHEKQDQYNVRVNRKILERVYGAPTADPQP